MIEEWKLWKDTRYTITKYGNVKKNARGFYWEVSNLGRVKRDGEVVEFPKNPTGYLQLGHYYLHRIVAETFIPNPDNKPQVDHIDTDRTNNVVTNLRWVTQSENNRNPITQSRQVEAAKNRKSSPIKGKTRVWNTEHTKYKYK